MKRFVDEQRKRDPNMLLMNAGRSEGKGMGKGEQGEPRWGQLGAGASRALACCC